MLNLLKLKQEKAAAKEGGEDGAKSGSKVIPAAQRRVQKGVLLSSQPFSLRACPIYCSNSSISVLLLHNTYEILKTLNASI